VSPIFALVGPGRVGQAVSRLLVEAGWELQALVGRDLQRSRQAARFVGCPETAYTELQRAATSPVILLATPDDSLAEVARQLRACGPAPGTLLVHFSGFHRARVLLQEGDDTLRALAIHPLQTFASPSAGVANLPGSPCSLEGDEGAMAVGEDLVRALGATPFRIRGEQKALYHAAACVLSNHLVANTRVACEILAACGVPASQTFELLMPLFEGTCRNLLDLGPEQALTGPVSRGDIETVRAHLEALESLPSGLQEAYRTLARQAARIGRERGTLSPDKARELDRLL